MKEGSSDTAEEIRALRFLRRDEGRDPQWHMFFPEKEFSEARLTVTSSRQTGFLPTRYMRQHASEVC